MFAGHYAAAIAAKAAEPRAPFWALVAGCQLVDIGWAVLILTGAEHGRIDPTLPGSALVLEHMPWTHSLPAAVLWSIAAAMLTRALLRTAWPAAAIIGLTVFSHWVLDLVVHRPDLELFPGGPKLGFGLWNFPVPEQAVEIGLIALAGVFWGAMRARNGQPAWPAALFILFLLAIQIAAMLLPQQASDSVTAMAPSALGVYLAAAVVAVFVDTRPEAAKAKS